MDFVKSYFSKNEPLTSWTLLSPIFFQISLSKYFLQNPYFRVYLDTIQMTLVTFITLLNVGKGIENIFLQMQGKSWTNF